MQYKGFQLLVTNPPIVAASSSGWCPSIACINEQRSDVDCSRVELCAKIACHAIAQQGFRGPCLVRDTCRHSGAIQFLSGMRLRESNDLRPRRPSREAISALRHMARKPPSHDDCGRWRTPEVERVPCLGRVEQARAFCNPCVCRYCDAGGCGGARSVDRARTGRLSPSPKRNESSTKRRPWRTSVTSCRCVQANTMAPPAAGR